MGVIVLPEGTAEGARVQGGKQAFTSQAQSDWVRPTDWPALPDVKATDHKIAATIAVRNDDANYLRLRVNYGGATSGTTSLTNITSGSSSTDATTYTTASISFVSGRSYIISVENSHGSSASSVSAITSGTAGLPTFTERATTQFNSNLNRVTVLTATASADWTGTITIQFGGTTQTGACWVVDSLTSGGSLTNDGVVQVVTATGNSASPSVTLTTLASNSLSYGVQAHAAATASTPGSGYTELADVTAATPGQALQTERLTAGTTTVDATITSAAWAMIGIEFAKGVVTYDWGDGTVDTVTTNTAGTTAEHEWTYSSLTAPVTTAGYKVVTLLVTSNSPIIQIELTGQHSALTGYSDSSTGLLDLVISAPICNSISVSGSLGSNHQRHAMLQRARILSSAMTSYANLFQECYSLRDVSVASSATVTSTASMFVNCTSMIRLPVFTTSSVTTWTSMFNGCRSLQEIPAFDTTAATTAGTMVSNCLSLRTVAALNFAALTTVPSFNGRNALTSIAVTGLTRGIDVGSCNLSKSSIETLFDNLGKASGAQTVTISTNRGAPTAISKTSSGTTSGSTTVTIADTSSLTTGMEISGTGISDAVAVTFQDTGDTVTRTAHGIPNDTPVSFATVVTTTGIATYTRYYVVNATANTFQVSDTVGGSAKALTTDGSGTCLYGTTITSITANTSIELSIPASATGSVTTSSALLKRSKARLKGFTVSG